MLWVIFAGLTVAFAAVLAAPLIRRKGAAPALEEDAASALKARLDDIERDRTAGLIGEEEASEAALEAQRAALAASPAEGAGVSRTGRIAALCLAGAAPLAAVWIYLAIGAPDYRRLAQQQTPQDAADVIAALPPEERQAVIEGMVAGLAARLEETPNDIDGWRMLVRSYAAMGRAADAAEASRRLLSLVEGDAADWRVYATALAELPPDDERAREFAGAVERLHALSPDDPLALYYLGAQARAAGDNAAAAAHWRRLLALLPPDAPVAPAIETMIDEAAADEAGAAVPE